MRPSRPMPRATSCTSPPTFSQMIGHLVDEGDLGGEKGVGGVFDQLAGFAAGEQDRRFVEIERAIDFAHHVARPFGVAAHHHAVGTAEILDRRAFAQEFRIGRHVEQRIGAGLLRMISSTLRLVPTGTVDLVTTTA